VARTKTVFCEDSQQAQNLGTLWINLSAYVAVMLHGAAATQWQPLKTLGNIWMQHTATYDMNDT
jgi:hypothetical protein